VEVEGEGKYGCVLDGKGVKEACWLSILLVKAEELGVVDG